MEAPPREKRARAAFFREKDAKRAAKQQRKKEKLTEKISRGGAEEKPVSSAAGVEVVEVKQVEPFARVREQRLAALLLLRNLLTLARTSARDPMVGLSSEAGRATMWQGSPEVPTVSEGRDRLSPTPGVSLGLIGERTKPTGWGRVARSPGRASACTDPS